MKKRIDLHVSQSGRMLIATLCLAVQGIWATTHVVQFGGSLGLAYSPLMFTATVGDTVKWEGDFSVHPLSSIVVPAGAQSWHMASGSSFSYRIAVAGSYAYRCDVHFASGMVGAFTATESAVRYNPVPSGAIRSGEIQVAVEDVSGMPFVALIVPTTRQITVKVFDLSGREQATIINRVVLAGTYSLPLRTAAPASGLYFVKLSGNGVQRVLPFFRTN